MKLNLPPRLFLSHASEDKERFVLRFATDLRANGIDVWLDRWEMNLGDSLVDKIFEEGLKDATAVLIVLSLSSVTKSWVREELNASVVARISRGAKLIPVVLDNCEIPEALKSTLWERVHDVNDYSACLDRVVAAVFNHSLRPPIGSPPGYAQSHLRTIDGLTHIDNLVLKQSCEALLETNDYIVDPEDLFGASNSLNVPKSEVSDSIEMLDHRGFLSVSRHLGDGGDSFGCFYNVTVYGFEAYARNHVDGYESMRRSIISAIVNEGIQSNDKLSKHLMLQQRLVDHVLLLLEQDGLVSISKYDSGGIHIYSISVALKRSLG